MNDLQFIPIQENKTPSSPDHIIHNNSTDFSRAHDSLDVALEAIRANRDVARAFIEAQRLREREETIVF